jgi:hypothetical protein
VIYPAESALGVLPGNPRFFKEFFVTDVDIRQVRKWIFEGGFPP